MISIKLKLLLPSRREEGIVVGKKKSASGSTGNVLFLDCERHVDVHFISHYNIYVFLCFSVYVVFYNKKGILKLFKVSYLCKYTIIFWIAWDNKLTDFSVDIGKKEGTQVVSETETADLAYSLCGEVKWRASSQHIQTNPSKCMCSKTGNGVKIKRITGCYSIFSSESKK